MPRPPRCRRICQAPQYETFSPEECPRESEAVTLTLDEYEVIRLVDLEKKTHEQCAAQMDISRTTVTEIYETAREKIARCIVLGQRLVIAGEITGSAKVGSIRAAGNAAAERDLNRLRLPAWTFHRNCQPLTDLIVHFPNQIYKMKEISL